MKNRHDLDDFFARHMKKGSRFIPARLQAGLALLEKLRRDESLNLDDHMASKGSSGLESHETYGDLAHQRLKLEPINKNHGRRSSSLRDWGQDLLDVLKNRNFSAASRKSRAIMIDDIQKVFGKILKNILEQEPLEAHVEGRTAESVIRDILCQAEDKSKAGDVAQYLVGAKLMLRFKKNIPINRSNKGDRKSRSDLNARSGDFEMADATIEVAVGLPDEKHIAQLAKALEGSKAEVWLLTRSDRVTAWQNELKNSSDAATGRRIVVTSVETFIGQNITELGEFSTTGKRDQLTALFNLYNRRWISELRVPGIKIVIK